MNAETNERREESFRLSTEQETEIGDILLSARTVSRQMILQAQEQIDDMMRKAEEQAAEKLREAEEQAAQITREAEEQAAEKLRKAEERAAQILQGAMGEKNSEAAGNEEGAEADAAAETEAAGQPEETARESAVLPEEMQEYVVRCVGDCFARLRQQQQETADFINEQWRCFLSGLSLPELPTPGAAPAETEGTGVTRQDIEDRVSAIARELMEIIGK
ncbi:MAG: hypothetical protein IKM82_04900 [Oscillospiraceae bacterium]|nr:hypothetical protein [Oscillospiraceae bacterium]MBR7074054.1 hypothetical protein [Oscillospiraceae bacterium]